MPLRPIQTMNKSRVVHEGTTKRYRDANFHSNYSTLNELGRGRFAVVRKCKHKETSRHYAAKFVRKRKMGRDCREDILKEIRILEKSFANQRLIGLHEVYETSTEVILVLEYASGGELHQYCVADKEDGFCERDVVRLLRQIIEGVHYLHSQNIAHLDLKPQNILLTSKELTKGDIKLIDFGIARHLTDGEEVRDIQGTPDYVAPEILNYEPITLATDMWSIGVLTYVMLTGISPFAGDSKQETFLNISQVNLDFADEDFECHSPEAQDFILSLCIKDAEKRLTAQECLEHPWIQKFTTEDLDPAEQGLDTNKNITTTTHQQQEKYSSHSSSTEVSSLTISLVLREDAHQDHQKASEDDENQNYLDNRMAGYHHQARVGGEVQVQLQVSSSHSCSNGAEDILQNVVRSGTPSVVDQDQHTSEIEIHMECESKDGLKADDDVDSDTSSSKDHHHSEGGRRSGQYSKGVDYVDGGLQKKEGSFVSQLQQQAKDSSSEASPSGIGECRSCDRLHAESPSQSPMDRSRSPSSSPLGTRRALRANSENLPKDIREPKRFCIQVSPQQTGQVVC